MLRGRGQPEGPRGGGRMGGGEAAGPPTVYQMREKLASIGDDFWIEKGGQKVYKVDGKALRVRDTLKMRDMAGNEVASIQEKMLRVRDTMDIERNGAPLATVRKALLTPLRARFTVDLAAGADARLSRDAGRYLCNYLSFRALVAARAADGPRLVAFIHVPPVTRTGLHRAARGRTVTMRELQRAGDALVMAVVGETRRRLLAGPGGRDDHARFR